MFINRSYSWTAWSCWDDVGNWGVVIGLSVSSKEPYPNAGETGEDSLISYKAMVNNKC